MERSKAVLKSGGPVMTILEETPDGQLLCQWKSPEGLQQALFHPDMLVIVSQ